MVLRNSVTSPAIIILGLALVVWCTSCESSSGGDGDGSAGAEVDTGGSGDTVPEADSTDDTESSTDGTDVSGDDAEEEDSILSRLWPEDRWITPTEVYERLVAGDPGMLPLNVVDAEFYDLGNIEGSLVIPWNELPGRLGEVDGERHVVIYCRRGVRSRSAYQTLTANGYELVWTMEGGLEAWLELEYPVVHDE